MASSSAPENTPPPLAVSGLGKRFGNTQALAEVSLQFRAGEIHAILGENGAGKSTLMHVLAGLLRPDSGTVLVDGRARGVASPRAARQAGIGMVHQHFALIETLTVAENLALALPGDSRWRYDAGATATAAADLARRIGLTLSPPEAVVAQLPVGARQRLEIVKALAHANRVLILDEPTAVLTPQEVQALFAVLQEVRAQGRAVVFITHKLREVKAVADRVTIMRRGRVVGTFAAAAVSEAEMAQHMLGELTPPRPHGAPPSPGEAGLSLSRLNVADDRGAPALVDIHLTVRAGEIFGIAGVDGNGQQELFEVLSGLRQPSSGTVRVGERELKEFTAPAALAAGIGHIPPDRQRAGLVLAMTVHENFLLSRTLLERCRRRAFFLDRLAARRRSAHAVRQYGIRAQLEQPVRALSGGNQQRLVVARALAEEPAVLVAANPGRGLDIAASRAVGEALLASARRGCAVLLISTDLDEVLELSQRVAVLSRGRLSAPLTPPIDSERLGLLMAGAAH